MNRGWIGVDFDGTLVTHEFPYVGSSIMPMIDRVKTWHAMGIEIRIVTARAAPDEKGMFPYVADVRVWCRENLGFIPQITNQKDWNMLCLFDDRCVQVEMNTGKILGDDSFLRKYYE